MHLFSSSLRAALVALVLTVGGFGCTESDSTEVVRVTSERAANRILVALDEFGVGGATLERQAERQDTTFIIRVPAGQEMKARRAIEDGDLLRPEHAGLAAIVDDSAIIRSPTDERARLMHAIAGELSQTLELADEVTSARVHVVLPALDALGKPRSNDATSALVVVRLRDRGVWPFLGAPADPGTPAGDDAIGLDVAPEAAQESSRVQIAALVAGAVEGLDAEAVAVTFVAPRGVSWVNEAGTGPASDGRASATNADVRNLIVAVVVLGLSTLGFGFVTIRSWMSRDEA